MRSKPRRALPGIRVPGRVLVLAVFPVGDFSASIIMEGLDGAMSVAGTNPLVPTANLHGLSLRGPVLCPAQSLCAAQAAITNAC